MRKNYIAPLVRTMLITLAGVGLYSRPAMLTSSSASSEQGLISSARPLYDVADMLEHVYRKPVTYEDPILVWPGDTARDPRIVVAALFPKTLDFVLPPGIDLALTPTLDSDVLSRVLDAYHRQTDGPRFRVSKSRWGFHIHPMQVRDPSGRFVDVASPLDTMITIPVAARSPSEHFTKILTGLNNAGGIRVKSLTPGGGGLESLFALGGDWPPTQTTVDWGATGITAREALITLSELSATTMTWRLWCNPEPWDRYCILIFRAIEKINTDAHGNHLTTAIMFDRCPKCASKLPQFWFPQ